MKRIEFVGASGSGKSTLLKIVQERRTEKDVWLTNDELQVQIAKRIEFDSPYISKKTLRILALKFNILKKKHPSISRRLLDNYKNDTIKKSLEKYNGLIDLIIDKFPADHIECPSMKMKLMDYWFDQVRQIALFDYFNTNKVVVFDENVIQNNPGTSDFKAYYEMLQSSPELASVINPIGIVFCNLSADTNIKRHMKRMKKAIQGKSEMPLINRFSKEDCLRRISVAEKKANVMQKVGVPVLELDMHQDLEENADDVLKFIKELQNY